MTTKAPETRAIMEMEALNRQFEENFPGQSGEILARKSHLAEFLQAGFPNTKHEEWKYTSVNALTSKPRSIQVPKAVNIDKDLIASILPKDSEHHLLVFVNGVFSPELSDFDKASGLKIGQWSQSEAASTVNSAPESSFVALNSAFATEGSFIYIPKGKSIEKLICVVHIGKTLGDSAVHTRSITRVGEGASAHVYEAWLHVSGDVLMNHVHEVHIGENANLRHDMVQSTSDLQLISFTQVNQGRNSQYHSMVLSTEGKLIRNNLHVLHSGQHCETHLNGLYLLNGQSHVDNHTLVDHAQPNSFSNELYKGVLSGKSTAVFNGKVMVRLDAQKTNAFQSNRTVLLSKGAKMNTKPQLEIFADDVKCSHGATTGQLDEEALFYLRSRGLSHHAAMSLLTFAFAAEVLEKLPEGAVRTFMHGIVEEKLKSLAEPS